jgi:alcohol dehydrogenase
MPASVLPAQLAGARLAISPTPHAYFEVGGIGRASEALAATGAAVAVVVTDQGLAATPILDAVKAPIEAAGVPVTVFSGVRPNPTTDDLAAGATAVAEVAAGGPVALVAVGGGSALDAAKGIAIAAVNPQRGRDLDYRTSFAASGLPIIAVPTTAGTGAETNAFGVVTDPVTRRKFYVGHPSTMPVAAILDPALTIGLPALATAATGLDALTHAIESYLSVRANPWSDGIALQVIRLVSTHLPAACADGADLEARSHLLLAAHMAGIGMATTGLGLVHAIGHALGGRYDIAHGVTLAMVLAPVLRFSQPARQDRLAAIAVALGAGDSGRDAAWNTDAAIAAVTALRERIGLTMRPADYGISEPDFGPIAADALADEVIVNAPRQPASADIESILAAADAGRER